MDVHLLAVIEGNSGDILSIRADVIFCGIHAFYAYRARSCYCLSLIVINFFFSLPGLKFTTKQLNFIPFLIPTDIAYG